MSLTLNGGKNIYSRRVLNNIWYEDRQQEPRDYDISSNPVRDLCRATYRRFGDGTPVDAPLPDTTYQNQCRSVTALKDDYRERPQRLPLVTDLNIKKADWANRPVLSELVQRLSKPAPPADMMTTHRHDYVAHFEMKEAAASQEPLPEPDTTAAHKRVLSQFTDIDNHRRWGRNTWHDESGVYCNSLLKTQLPQYARTDTIPERLN